MKPALHSCIAAILFATHIVFAQADPCKEETQKAEIMYGMCMKFDKESTSYIDCVKLFMEQKAISDEACKAPAPSDCEVQKGRAKAIYEMCLYMDRDTDDYVECAEDYKNQNIKAEEVCRANPIPVKPKAAAVPRRAAAETAKPASLSQALSGSGLSSICVEDFSSILGKSSFNMSNFAKDLVPEVAKVKLKLKSPFGKPKDGDRTSVGLTVGCIKSLPESPAEIQSLLKNIALKAGLNFVATAVAGSGNDDDEYYYPKDFGKSKKGDKKGVRFGFRAGYNINDFYSGYTAFDEDIGIGLGYGAGFALNIPLASVLRLNMGVSFYDRDLFNDINEGIISIPVLFQIGKPFYYAIGVQTDIPIWLDCNWCIEDNRASVDFGLALGLGYMFENIGLDLKFVYGLTRLFEDFTIDSRRSYRSSLRQYGLGVSYFF
jgi:hypothetical protein